MRKFLLLLSLTLLAGGPAFADEQPTQPVNQDASAAAVVGVNVDASQRTINNNDPNKSGIPSNIPESRSDSQILYNTNDPRGVWAQDIYDVLFRENPFVTKEDGHLEETIDGVVVTADIPELPMGVVRADKPGRVIVDFVREDQLVNVKVTPFGIATGMTKPKDSRYSMSGKVLGKMLEGLRRWAEFNGLNVHVIVPIGNSIGHTIAVEGSSAGFNLGGSTNGYISDALSAAGVGGNVNKGVTSSLRTTSVTAQLAVEDPNGSEFFFKSFKKEKVKEEKPVPEVKPVEKRIVPPRKKAHYRKPSVAPVQLILKGTWEGTASPKK